MVKLEKSWFAKTKYVPHIKYQSTKKKYCEKIVKVISVKKFDEEMTIDHLLKLLNQNKNEMIEDLVNLKKENSYFIKILDSFKDCDLTLSINLKKTKDGKMKLCVKIKEKTLDEDKEEVIVLIKREIYDLFGNLI